MHAFKIFMSVFKYIITGKYLHKCFELGQWSPNYASPQPTTLWLTSFLTKDANISHLSSKLTPQCPLPAYLVSCIALDFSLEIMSFPKEMNCLKNSGKKTGLKFYDVFVLLYTLDLQLMNSWRVICSSSGWMVLLEKGTDELKHLTLIIPQF